MFNQMCLTDFFWTSDTGRNLLHQEDFFSVTKRKNLPSPKNLR